MESMTDYQYAWMMYLFGAVGCSLAAWLLFRRAGRAWVHFVVITVMVILFTPYAVDAETMTMAPAVYTLLFGFMEGGFIAIKPVLKVMLGLWIGTLVLSLIYQLLTRNRSQAQPQAVHRQKHTKERHYDEEYAESARRASTRPLTREERMARDELMHEEPIRAVR